MIIIKKEARESRGIGKKPNSTMLSSEQEMPWPQGWRFCGMNPKNSRQ